MLQLENPSGFPALIYVAPDADGVESVYTVLKATFSLGASLSVATEQVPVTLADKHNDEPGTSSIAVPSDISLSKRGTDVVLLGSAYAPSGRPTWQMDVSLVAGPLQRTIRVSADRVWQAGAGGPKMAWVEPFLRMPLVWERAFGGRDQTDKGIVAEPRNPVGVGFRSSGSARELDGAAIPNLEEPGQLIASARDCPPPACFAPVSPHWEPRKSFAGTYDDAWQQSRAPFLPSDFDSQFFQIAPTGLSARGFFRGGENVEAVGVTPGNSLRFRLPVVQLSVTYTIEGASQRPPVALDTIIIEPDASRFSLVYRAVLPTDKRTLRLEKVHTAVHSIA